MNITNEKLEILGEVNEKSSLYDMEKGCPLFFKTKFGKRETYSVYRGQLIVRYSVQFTNGTQRLTSVYLFFGDDLNCISSGSDINTEGQAKKLIDRVLDGGIYRYGI
jgi:hypothetical protein